MEIPMHQPKLYLATAAAFILVAIAGWANSSTRPFEAKASTPAQAQIDTFVIVSSARNLPLQDFTLLLSPTRERAGS
jgi:hypothetical protein